MVQEAVCACLATSGLGIARGVDGSGHFVHQLGAGSESRGWASLVGVHPSFDLSPFVPYMCPSQSGTHS